MTHHATIAHRTLCAAMAHIERDHAANALRRLAESRTHDRVRRPGHGTERAESYAYKRAKRALRAARRWESQARAYGLEVKP